MKGVRLDIRMAELGLAPSREKAQSLIMAGKVFVDGKQMNKSGAPVSVEQAITVAEDDNPYVSRGGLKLEKALTEFSPNLSGAVAADIGASTGGFTDCMLKNGAKTVYAIDVGYGQLDWKLRNDDRVIVMEKTNARNMEPCWYKSPLDFASVDVSFISLKLILKPLFACLREEGQVVALIKPQFEAGKEKVGKNGVIKSAKTHAEVIEKVIADAKEIGYSIENLSYSPIKGPKGNIEFLMFMNKKDTEYAHSCDCTNPQNIENMIAEAHLELNNNTVYA